MPTKQLPFFLNSAKGSNLTPLGNAFDVKLDPPVKIPSDARDTRISTAGREWAARAMEPRSWSAARPPR
jgi:hypothetical protein